MANEIGGAFWGHYKNKEAEASVYARQVTVRIIEPKGIPTLEYHVRSFNEATGPALLVTGSSANTFTADFLTIRSIKPGGQHVKMMVSEPRRMFMEEKYKDGEPPSLVIPIILVVGVILLLVIVFNK